MYSSSTLKKLGKLEQIDYIVLHIKNYV